MASAPSPAALIHPLHELATGERPFKGDTSMPRERLIALKDTTRTK